MIAGAALLFLAVPGSVSAGPAAIPATSWVPPTPAEGTQLTAAVGRELAFSLAATAPGAPVVTVSIRGDGLPAGAIFQSTTGNPGTASVNWAPTRAQAGRTFHVTFAADASIPGITPATRHVTLAVIRPKRTRKPKPKSFALSSSKQELYRYAFVIRQVVARSAPRRMGSPLAKLDRWTPEGTTNLVSALEGRRTKHGAWIKVEGSPHAADRRPAAPDGDAVPQGQADLSGSRRSRTAAMADPARRVLHPQPALRVREPRLRPDRLRNECPFRSPHRLAGRGIRRDPRNEPAGDPSGSRLARLYPAEEPAHPQAGEALAGRDAADRSLGPCASRPPACRGRSSGRDARARRTRRSAHRR